MCGSCFWRTIFLTVQGFDNTLEALFLRNATSLEQCKDG